MKSPRNGPRTSVKSVEIHGSGLIGTSLGLALVSAGVLVRIFDQNPQSEALSRDLLGNQNTFNTENEADLIIIATPSKEVAGVISSLKSRNSHLRVIDIASTKTNVMQEVESLSGLNFEYCSTHPMAGRESSGPESARADLFESRAWIVTPGKRTTPELLAAVMELIDICGASAYTLTALEHDQLMAGISHLPQFLSSLLAGSLSGESEENLALAGQGLRDVTRLASSDPKLWADIFDSNREAFVLRLDGVSKNVENFKKILQSRDLAGMEKFISDGQREKKRISGKHGAKAREYTYLPIVIDDQPGALGALFAECAKVSVNVEDLTLEHSPGQITGLITLALSERDADILAMHLLALGWKVHKK